MVHLGAGPSDPGQNVKNGRGNPAAPDTWSCEVCDFQGSYDRVRHHKLSVHVLICKIKLNDYTEFEVQRGLDNFFTCEHCLSKVKSAKSFASRHKNCYEQVNRIQPNEQGALEDGEAVEEAGDEEVGDFSDHSDEDDDREGELVEGEGEAQIDVPVGNVANRGGPENFTDMLKRYLLEYYPESGLLTCTACDHLVFKEVPMQHVVRNHQMRMTSSEQDAIRAHCFEEVSSYNIPSQPLLQPLPFLPVINGYACRQCPFYCEKKQSAKKHIRKKHANVGEFGSSKVQSPNFGIFKRSIGVLDVGPREGDLIPGQGLDQLAAEMQRIVQPRNIIEPPNQRSFFYSKTKWHDENDVNQDFSELAAQVLPGDPDYNLHVHVWQLFKVVLDDIRDLQYTTRMNIANASGDEYDFRYLESDDTRKAYAKDVANLVIYAKRLVDGDHMEPIENLTTFIQDQNRENLMNLLLQLIEDEPRDVLEIETVLAGFLYQSTKLQDGSLMKPEMIGKMCAKFLYMIRVVFSEQIRYLEGEALKLRFEEMKHIISLDNYNNFSFFVRHLALAKHDEEHRGKLPAVMKTGNPGELKAGNSLLNINGVRLGIANLRASVKGLTNDLLCGFLPNISFSHVSDNFQNCKPGYMFQIGQDVETSSKIRSQLAFHIANDAALKRRFYSDFDSLSVRIAEASSWLLKYDKLQEQMILLVHLLSGMPARATELETYKLSNGPSAPRSVYVLSDQIFFLPHYNKTRNIASKEKMIARFLDTEGSYILLLDLVYLRPFAGFLWTKLGKNTENIYMTEMFVLNGAKMDAEKIRNVFAKQFNIFVGAPLPFSIYRQVAASFAWDVKIPITADNFEEEEDDQGSIIARQFGHSHRVAMDRYGKSNTELMMMRDVHLQNYRNISSSWQSFLGVGSGVREEPRRTLVGQIVDPIPTPTLNVRPGLVTNSLTFVEPKRVKLSPPLRLESGYKARLALQKVFRSQDAKFTSIEQTVMIEKVLFAEKDVIAIMATGQGKSLAFFAYAVHYPSKTALVIVPTVSLVADLIARSIRLGISAADSLQGSHTSLIFLTPEKALTEPSKMEIARLYATGTLGKLFFDEAHVFTLEKDFRPIVRNLPILSPFGAPMVALSGSVSDEVLCDLRDNFFGRDRILTVIRQRTNRLNIKYVVREGAYVLGVLQLIEEKMRTLDINDRMIVWVVDIDGDLTTLSGSLTRSNVSHSVYHSRLRDEEKAVQVRNWRNPDNQTRIMIATSAFGVGIDYPRVRISINYKLPFSLDEFVQQSGRAGRDHQPAEAILLYSPNDSIGRMNGISEETIKQRMGIMFEFAMLEGTCYRRFISSYFDGVETCCDHFPNCVKCGACEQFIPDTNFIPTQREMTPRTEPSLDATFAQTKISRKYDFLVKLKGLIDYFQDKCIICFCKRKRYHDHISDPARCPSVINACFVCLDTSHGYNVCPLKSIQPVGHCYKCYLPASYDNFEFHAYNGYGRQCTRSNNVLKYFVMVTDALNFKSYVTTSDQNYGVLKIHTAFVDSIGPRMPN